MDAERSADAADTVDAADGIGPVVPVIADMDVTGTAGVPGAIWPVGVAQVTTVPGVVGSEASGTGASVVSGVPGWVVAENGLGPLSGEVTIVARRRWKAHGRGAHGGDLRQAGVAAQQQDADCEQQASRLRLLPPAIILACLLSHDAP